MTVSPPERVHVRERLVSIGLGACLALLVLGAHWATVVRFGSDMPNWDQWDAEATNLLIPWFEHRGFLHHLFVPHNEHRVILTKLQNLAVVLISGQWDARLECGCNAVLFAGIAVGWWMAACRWFSARWRVPLFIVLAGLFTLPLASENVLSGFHSQQYWLIGLSIAAIVLFPSATPWSGRWWLGAAAMVLALGSMASGFLAAFFVLGLAGWRLLRREGTLREVSPTLVLSALVVAIGAGTMVRFPGHADLKAGSVVEFCLYTLRSLEWPLHRHDWGGAVIWLPWLSLVTVHAWRAERDPIVPPRDRWRIFEPQRLVIALGGWVLVQIAATAYARGAGADYPAPRYVDTLIIGVVVNAFAVVLLVNSAIGSGRQNVPAGSPVIRRGVLGGIALAWVGVVASGVILLGRHTLAAELPDTRHSYFEPAERHIRAYLATNDPAELVQPIPYPDEGWLQERLSHPDIRRLQPQSVRPPLPLQAATSSGTPFLPNDVSLRQIETAPSQSPAPRHGLAPATPPLPSRRTWGSYDDRGTAGTGEWRSARLTATLHGWLRFDMAGDIGTEGFFMELRDAQTDRPIERVHPTLVPGNRWLSAYVPAPRQPFRIVARDDSTSGWFAFSAPVEMSNPSFWAWQIMKRGLGLCQIAAVIAVPLGFALWRSDQRTRVSLDTGSRRQEKAVKM